ncbi:hypothetical protein [Neisseria dentiae]|uniref:hypothetical protein n=1 Tax=Neisseria dentiae TaxID=194197 RepID=UPI0035A16458
MSKSKAAPRKQRICLIEWWVLALWLVVLGLALADCACGAPEEWPQDKEVRLAEQEALRIAETYQIDYTKGDAEVSWEDEKK